MQMLLAVLMAWLVAATGLPPAEQPPRVAFASAEQMAAVRHDRLAPGGSGRAPVSFSAVHAIYDDQSKTIYLPSGWSAASPADVSLLVHELTHHLQHSADQKFACAAARERQAYKAQARWLELFGTSLSDEFGIDAATVLALSVCTH